MTTFQPGQKVRYIGERLFEDDPPHGVTGTVIRTTRTWYVVDFGNGETSAYESELEAAS